MRILSCSWSSEGPGFMLDVCLCLRSDRGVHRVLNLGGSCSRGSRSLSGGMVASVLIAPGCTEWVSWPRQGRGSLMFLCLPS